MGAFEFDHVPSIEELDFEYMQVNCIYFDDMGAKPESKTELIFGDGVVSIKMKDDDSDWHEKYGHMKCAE